MWILYKEQYVYHVFLFCMVFIDVLWSAPHHHIMVDGLCFDVNCSGRAAKVGKALSGLGKQIWEAFDVMFWFITSIDTSNWCALKVFLYVIKVWSLVDIIWSEKCSMEISEFSVNVLRKLMLNVHSDFSKQGIWARGAQDVTGGFLRLWRCDA